MGMRSQERCCREGSGWARGGRELGRCLRRRRKEKGSIGELVPVRAYPVFKGVVERSVRPRSLMFMSGLIICSTQQPETSYVTVLGHRPLGSS